MRRTANRGLPGGSQPRRKLAVKGGANRSKPTRSQPRVRLATRGGVRIRTALSRGWMNAMKSAEQTVAGRRPVTLQTSRDGTIVTGQFLTVADRGLHATESHPGFSVTYSGPGGETQTIRYRSDGRPFAILARKSGKSRAQ